MKRVKKLLLVISIFLVVLIGAAAAIPFFFKDQLVEKAKTVINNNVNAVVDFDKVGLSLFKHFPNITLSLSDLSVTGMDDFDGIRLASAKNTALTLDIMSVIRGGDLTIKNIDVDQPDVHVVVLSDGKANYDIAKAASTSTEETSSSSSSNFKMALKNYSIQNASVIYDDESLDTYLDVKGLDHNGSGAFTLSVYDLDTKTNIEEISLDYGGISYLTKAEAQLDAIFNIDQGSNTYTLKDNDLVVNALRLIADGYVQLQGDDTKMDLKINAPQNDFKNLLSLVPGAYLVGYEDVKANGQFQLDGIVKGTYNAPKSQMPSFAFNLKVDDADVQYPDLPLGIQDISTQASINSPSNDLDDLQIDIPAFNLKIGSNPIAGRFRLETPLSDPDVDTKIDGTLDLAELAKAFPMEGMEDLSGQIVANVEARAKMSQIDQGAYEDVDMSGDLQVVDVIYKYGAYPEIDVNRLQMSFSPKYVEIQEMDTKLGKSDLKGSGRIDNILAYFSPKTTMKGDLTLSSDYFFVDEWMPASEDAETEPTAGQLDTTNTSPSDLFDRYDFKVDAQAKEIVYDKYTLNNTLAKGRFSPNRLFITQASTQIDESDIAANGRIYNVMDYLFAGEQLTGNVNVKSNKLNLNPFMTMMETTESENEPVSAEDKEVAEYGVILVPDNIKMQINADVKELIYTNMNIKNLSGALKVADKAVELRNVKGEALGGKVTFTGLYDTQDETEPYYGMKLGMDRLNFQNAFNTLNTFQRLAPIGQFVEGILNTTLSLKGTLGNGMMPDLSTLNAAGFLETLDGSISNFPLFQKLGESLQIEEFAKAVKLENTKNWMEIKDGLVEVKPFDFTLDGIDMAIAGKHGLNQSMDYNINAAIPRAKLENNALGAAVGQGLQSIQKEAAKLGLPIKNAEFVNVLINITGSLTDPQIKVKLLGLDGETTLAEAATDALKDQLDEEKEKLQEQAEEKLNEEKEKVAEKANELADSAKTALGQKVDDLGKQAGSKVDSLLKGKTDTVLNKESKKIIDTLLKNKEIDKVKKELEKFNPFKKDKKKTEEKKKTGGG